MLGFYDKEVYRYIFREIDLLSLIGSLVGLVVGIPLHQFIIRTVEMDQMMFIRSIAPRSWIERKTIRPPGGTRSTTPGGRCSVCKGIIPALSCFPPC